MIPPWPQWSPVQQSDEIEAPRWYEQATRHQGSFYRLSWNANGLCFLDRDQDPSFSHYEQLMGAPYDSLEELQAALIDLRAHLPERLMEALL